MYLIESENVQLTLKHIYIVKTQVQQSQLHAVLAVKKERILLYPEHRERNSYHARKIGMGHKRYWTTLPGFACVLSADERLFSTKSWVYENICSNLS
jgi:hypothetical protein